MYLRSASLFCNYLLAKMRDRGKTNICKSPIHNKIKTDSFTVFLLAQNVY
ncbi:hypothetical protein SAMN04489796_10619 [Winogradskyella thalassocola]|uniref:Uncharacterized protein n=1 Tax=Winogradskyella thalassocola TaxID=262004 RepID=A0A1G8GST4_9FLAO|nr:hypothetical protein SAMN04489796_10619 [Winogradskyella thalassocola]